MIAVSIPSCAIEMPRFATTVDFPWPSSGLVMRMTGFAPRVMSSMFVRSAR